MTRLPVLTRPALATTITPRYENPLKTLAWGRYPLLAASILILLSALWGGWIRMGWAWPVIQPSLVSAHGPLMVAGFLGTLIAVERAVALRRAWTYLPPALCALGGVVLIAGLPPAVGALLITLGSLGLVAVFIEIVRRQTALYTLTMAAGTVLWLGGNLLWLSGRPIYQVVLWWAAFLILTIAGERLEMGRLVRLPRRAEALFLAAAGLYTIGLLAGLAMPALGARLVAAGMLALGLWLLRYDIARFTVRRPGLPRYAAICLLSGYVWMAFAGLYGLWQGALVAGLYYDALLHAVFVGFVLSMIFGHAPIIFPAVLGRPIRFSTALYMPLVVLHASLVLRVVGDLPGSPAVRLWGGLFNGLALLIFLGMNAVSVVRGDRAAKETTSPPGRQTREEILN